MTKKEFFGDGVDEKDGTAGYQDPAMLGGGETYMPGYEGANSPSLLQLLLGGPRKSQAGKNMADVMSSGFGTRY